MRLVIFDYDGTLVDTAPWFFRSLNSVARKHGFREVTAEEGESLRDLPSREILRHLRVPLWKLPAIAKDMRRRVLAEDSEIPMFPWVPGLLQRLAEKGIVVAVVSSNSEEAIRRKLGPCLGHIRLISAGSSLFGKPARLRGVLRSTGMTSGLPVCVGDEIRDIEAARTIDAAAYAVTWGLSSARGLAAANPDALISEPAQLEALLLRDPARPC